MAYRQYSGGMDATARVYRRTWRRGSVASGGTRAAAGAALAVGIFLAPGLVGPVAIPLAFAGFSAYAVTTVLLRQPWTSEFSRAAYPQQAGDSPLFVRINMILSALWALLFLLLALAHMLSAGLIVTYGIVVVGAFASIFGPRWARRMHR